MKTGFLTREERLVFMILSGCLLGGGVFQLAASFLPLPQALRPPSYEATVVGTDSSSPSDVHPGARPRPDAEFCSQEETGPEPARRASAEGRAVDAGTRDETQNGSGESPHPTDSCEASGRLDLNTATSVELEALPGIGPALAARIVRKREETGGFRSVEELLEVRGIGEKTLSRLRDWVCVSPPQTPPPR
jgi:comEA protein